MTKIICIESEDRWNNDCRCSKYKHILGIGLNDTLVTQATEHFGWTASAGTSAWHWRQ